MKKIILFLLFINLFIITPAFSFDGFINLDNMQIRSILNKHNKALSSHNTKLVKTFYDENYKSSDGYNLEDLISMLDKTFKSYDNIKYKTKVNSVKIYNDWALAQMSDECHATVYPTLIKKLKKEKSGKLYGKSVYNIFLKKEDNSWKIVSEDVLMEETSLKYGIAKDIKMDLDAPLYIKGGEQYDISLKMDKPEDIIALASISREEVIYPPVDYQEKFRKFPENGDLERLVKANKKNLDEYAVASVGFTKVSVNDEMNKARIEVLGMAYLMKRINMERIKAQRNQEVKKL